MMKADPKKLNLKIPFKDELISQWAAIRDKRVVTLLETTIREFNRDNSSLLAAAVSYYLLFSLFPFMLAIISISGFILESPAYEDQLINALATLIPVARNMLVYTLQGLVSARTTTGMVAIAGMIYSALAFFSALRRALNTAWGIAQPYAFFKGQLTDIIMMIGALILLFTIIWTTTSIQFMQDLNPGGAAGRLLDSRLFTRLLFIIISFLVTSSIIILLYKFVPMQRPRWRDIWPGALLAAGVFEAVRFIFIWYVKNYGQYNIIYGAVGSIIALLAFIYIFIYILLFIARLTAVSLRMNECTKVTC